MLFFVSREFGLPLCAFVAYMENMAHKHGINWCKVSIVVHALLCKCNNAEYENKSRKRAEEGTTHGKAHGQENENLIF